MKIFDVVTIGSALKDIMFYSDQIDIISNKKNVLHPKMLAVGYGAKIPIDEVFVNYGGGALNVGVGLKNFGIDVSPLINVGNDQVGKEIHYYLNKQKIDTSLMNVDKERRTGFSLIMTAATDREHTIFTYKGASSFLKLPSLRGFRTKWFYVSALSSKDWAYEFEKITRQTKRNVKIAWNPGSLQLKNHRVMRNFLGDIEVLILNKDEATEFVYKSEKKVLKKDLARGKFLLKKIQEYGPQKVVITLGAKGVIALDEHGKYYSIPAKNDKKRIVDTVGAGDSFSSGMMAGLVKWLNFEKALQLGIKNSAMVLTKAGAQNGLLKIKL
jgi:ribokinase